MKLEKCLVGRRICLRNYAVTDLPFLTDMWFDEENGRYMSDPTRDYVNDIYQHALDTLQDSTDGYYLVMELIDTKERVGSAGIFLTEIEGVYDIGYCVHKHYWKQGFGSEAVTLMLEWLTDHGAKKVMAEVAVDNIPSNGLLRKFGFEVEKEAEFKKYNMDVRFDSYIYAKSL